MEDLAIPSPQPVAVGLVLLLRVDVLQLPLVLGLLPGVLVFDGLDLPGAVPLEALRGVGKAVQGGLHLGADPLEQRLLLGGGDGHLQPDPLAPDLEDLALLLDDLLVHDALLQSGLRLRLLQDLQVHLPLDAPLPLLHPPPLVRRHGGLQSAGSRLTLLSRPAP